MHRAQFRATFPAAILLAAISLSTMPAHAQTDGRWALSLGGGYADQFTYQSPSSGTFDVGSAKHFDFSALGVIGAGYQLTDRVTLQAEAGYLGYRKALPLNPARSLAVTLPRENGSLTAQMPFFSMGARFYASGPGSARPRPYFEASPTLWVARWEEHFQIGESHDLAGNSYPGQTGQDGFTTLEPGFTAGAGLLGSLVGRTRLDLGFRYLFSMGAGQRKLGQYSSGTFEGLRQVAFLVSVNVPF